jgi:hypothetical protein
MTLRRVDHSRGHSRWSNIDDDAFNIRDVTPTRHGCGFIVMQASYVLAHRWQSIGRRRVYSHRNSPT